VLLAPAVVAITLIGPLPALAAAKSTTPPRPTGSFASGMVAGLSGSTMEVQSTTGQTTVTVSPTTSFTQIEHESASDIGTGDCVRATGSGSTTKGIKATTVSITKATASGCASGFPGAAGGASGFGGGASGFGGGSGRFRGPAGTGGTGTRPSFPTNGHRPGNFATASGSVTAVKGDTVTVKARVLKTSASTKTKKKPQFVTKSVKVTIASSATVTTTATATSAQLANGTCVSAIGPASTTGAIAATSITISQPVNGTCSAGFGGGFGGRFGGGGGAGGEAT
jgi:hypothetical protein